MYIYIYIYIYIYKFQDEGDEDGAQGEEHFEGQDRNSDMVVNMDGMPLTSDVRRLFFFSVYVCAFCYIYIYMYVYIYIYIYIYI